MVAVNGTQHGIIVSDFTNILQETMSIDIFQYDERLSTITDNRLLSESNMNWRRKKNNIDKVAAGFILQGLLDNINYCINPLCKSI